MFSSDSTLVLLMGGLRSPYFLISLGSCFTFSSDSLLSSVARRGARRWEDHGVKKGWEDHGVQKGSEDHEVKKGWEDHGVKKGQYIFHVSFVGAPAQQPSLPVMLSIDQNPFHLRRGGPFAGVPA